MTSFADNYVEQMRKGIEAWHEKMFPTEIMDNFERSAAADISINKNVCWLHSDKVTFKKLYPEGFWCCDNCAQSMFQMGILNGRVIFDMRRD